MLFNSFTFIFVFLPIVFVSYFLFQKMKLHLFAKIILVVGSLVFYGWWNIHYLPLILISIVVNFIVGNALHHFEYKKIWLLFGLTFNIGLLVYFKYMDFFISNINIVFDQDFSLLYIALPLAISFFTFQQIAYIVDAYRGEKRNDGFLNYMLFVTFFPQLIAGPIVRHQEMMPQFSDISDKRRKKINVDHIAKGLFIFSIGLFKKVGLADTFAVFANQGFQNSNSLTFLDGWITSLAYTFQIYFDFSGYTDMALGIALFFNILLPVNFNSPYKAINIQDFWRRWHITLSRFLSMYIYIPLGGSRKGKSRTYVNIFLLFLVSGFWHGAGWTFIIWGSLHGLASIVLRYWSTFNVKMNTILAWFITFMFVNGSWVFFRATSVENAINVLRAMLGFNGVVIPLDMIPNQAELLAKSIPIDVIDSFALGFDKLTILWLLAGFMIILFFKNSVEKIETTTFRAPSAIFASSLFIYSVLNLNKISEFIYFNF